MKLAARFRAIVRLAGMRTPIAAMLAATVLATAPASARAGSISFTTPSGSTTGGGSVDARAVFTLKSGEIDITLTNLGKNPTADSQLISALTFNVTGATGTTDSLSSSGETSTVTTKKGSTKGDYTAGVLTNPLPAWKATHSGTSFNLTALGGTKPSDLIIGPDDHGGFDPTKGKYSGANSSIGQHSPAVLGTATFAITVAGVTSSSKLSDMTFQFGTTAGSNLVVGVQGVPEPSTLVMGLSALGMATGVVIRRRRRAA